MASASTSNLCFCLNLDMKPLMVHVHSAEFIFLEPLSTFLRALPRNIAQHIARIASPTSGGHSRGCSLLLANRRNRTAMARTSETDDPGREDTQLWSCAL